MPIEGMSAFEFSTMANCAVEPEREAASSSLPTRFMKPAGPSRRTTGAASIAAGGATFTAGVCAEAVMRHRQQRHAGQRQRAQEALPRRS